MTENNPITNVIFALIQRIKNLKEQLARKTQECEKKSWEIGNLGYKIKNQRKEINERLKQLKAKEQECEELREYHNKCCEEFENEKKELLEKYNQLSRDFYSGKYCNVEKCKQLSQLNVENKEIHDKGQEGINKLCVEKSRLYNELDNLKIENEQAEQKLERIREIIKQMNNECFYNDFDCKDCDMKNGCTYFNKSIILQTIDEVE